MTEYAKLVHKMSFKDGKTEMQEKPFQDLLFMVRNWPFPEDHAFGLQGGTEYIIGELSVQEDTGDTEKQIRETIHDTYKNIHGYLLPYPGRIVAGKSNYLGEWGAMHDEFRAHFFKLIEWVFKKENIVKKKVLGRELNGKEYYLYIKAYCDIYRSSEFPQSPDIYNATVDRQNRILIDESFLIYDTAMKEYATLNVTIESADLNATFTAIHNDNKEIALQHFKSKPKLGTKELEKFYEEQLVIMIDTYFEEWCARVLMYYNSFIDLQRNANQTISNMMIEKEKELVLTMQKHNETINALNGNIDSVSQQLENDKKQNDNQIKEQQKKLNDIQNQLDSSIKDQESKIQDQQEQFQKNIEEMKRKQQEEDEQREKADRERAEDFQRKIEAMTAENLKNSEAYNATIKEYEEKRKAEKLLREQEDLVRAQEMEKIKEEHKNTEERIRNRIVEQKKVYQQQQKDIEAKIEENKKQRIETLQNYLLRQQQMQDNILELTRENNAKIIEMQEKEFADIRKMREDFKSRQEEERQRRNKEIARIQANIRRNGSSNCVPNKFFINLILGFSIIVAIMKISK